MFGWFWTLEGDLAKKLILKIVLHNNHLKLRYIKYICKYIYNIKDSHTFWITNLLMHDFSSQSWLLKDDYLKIHFTAFMFHKASIMKHKPFCVNQKLILISVVHWSKSENACKTLLMHVCFADVSLLILQKALSSKL